MAKLGYFRIEAKVLSRSKGHAMTPAYAYRTATKQRDDETGKIYDFTRKRDVYLCEMMSPANAPEWISDRQRLWAEVEKVERRKDSQLAREIVLCFPNCLTNDEKVAVTRDYVQKEFVWRGMVADIAYHSFEGKYKNNPHAHVLLTMRSINEKGFGQKNRDWNSDALLENWREQWAHHLNKYLERGGYEIRVDHRSYEAQGIDRAPTLHEGRAATQKRRRGASTSVTERNDDIKQLNADMERAQAELRNEQAREAWKQKHREERIARREAQKQLLAQEQDNTPDAKQPDIKDLAAQTREVIAPTLVRQSEDSATSPQITMKDEPQLATSAPTSTESKPEREQQQRSGGGDGTEPPQPPRTMKYLTWHNVNRQLEAMGGDGRFDIGIGTRNEETEKIERMESLRQQWQNNGFLTKAEILKYDPKTGKTPIIDALKGENANGKEIFIRLAPTTDGKQQGVFLVDDIEEVTIEDLKARGITPAVVVETSHKNCQAWIRVSREAVEKETATQLARLLTKEYGGDPASASYQHYGRLVGFTNRKEKHRHAYTGKYPYVKLVESTGLYTPNGEQWVERARAAAAIEREKIEKAAAVREQLSNNPATHYQQQRALKMFDTLFDRFWQRRTSNDYSKTDWAVLKHMIKRLGYSNEDALRHALRHGSPDLAKRKAGHTEDYVDRTIMKLLQQPDVLEAIAQRQQRHLAKVQQSVNQPQKAESVQAPASKEKDLDQRKVIEQWQQIKDAGKERNKGGADAASQPRRQPEDGRHRDNPRPASGNAPDKNTSATPNVSHSGDTRSIQTQLSKSAKAPLHNSSYFQWLQAQNNPHQHHDPKIDSSTAHLPPANLEAVGDLDAASVAAVIQAAHTSKNSAQQLRMAAWAYLNFQKDEGTWNKCKLEYLRELHRRQRALGKDGVLHPNTDVEIALRLRMAGFSNTQIYNVIRATSPLTISLPSVDHQNVYLKKAIYPYLNNGKALTAAKNFENDRRRQAAKLPPDQQQAYLQERRLDKLGLATPVPPPEPSAQRNRRPSAESPGSQPPKRRDDQQRER